MDGFSNYANISIVIYVLYKLSLHLTRAFGLKVEVDGKLILTGYPVSEKCTWRADLEAK